MGYFCKTSLLLLRPNERINSTPKESNITGVYPPLGLGYIASYVREKFPNVKVDILDAHANNFSFFQIFQEIKKYAPDLIGISSTSLVWPYVKKMVKEIKKDFSNPLVAVGGPHVTLYPVECVESSDCDIAIYGEGEVTFSKIIESIRKGEGFDNIKGITYKKNGKIVRNPPRLPIEDLNKLPFPSIELLPMEKYFSLTVDEKFVPMITTRGCTYSCDFCSPNYLGPYRERSKENVVKEIEKYVKERKIQEIIFFDENFTYNKERTIEICKSIINKELKFDWNIRTRIDNLDEEILYFLKKAGCKSLHVGVESGVDWILKEMNKNVTTKQIRSKLELIKKYGFQVRGYFMLGYPEENFIHTLKTVFFPISLPLDWVSFSITTANPGTELYNYFKQKNKFDYWKMKTLRPHSLNSSPVIQSSKFKLILLKLIRVVGYFLFYFNPRIGLKKLIYFPYEIKKIIKLLYRILKG